MSEKDLKPISIIICDNAKYDYILIALRCKDQF